MSIPQQPSFRYPFILVGHPTEIQNAHMWAFNAIQDLQRANEVNVAKLNAKTVTTITTTSGGGGGGVIPVPTPSPFAGMGAVNDQTGVTTYTVVAHDNGILLIFNDASPVAVTLNSGLPTPYFFFAANTGAGVATMTPTSGLINGGASLALLKNESVMVVFDGTNWITNAFFAPPLNSPASSTKFLTAYASATGVFSNAQPAFTDISGTLAAGQLPATVPLISFGAGAPVGSSTEGYLYFDTTLATYVGYVYHSGAWNQIQ